MKTHTSPQSESLARKSFIMATAIIFLIALCGMFYVGIKLKKHDAPTAKTIETNQVSEVATAAPEPALTNIAPQVEAAALLVQTNKTLASTLNTNAVKHLNFRVKPMFGQAPLAVAGGESTNTTVQQN